MELETPEPLQIRKDVLTAAGTRSPLMAKNILLFKTGPDASNLSIRREESAAATRVSLKCINQ